MTQTNRLLSSLLALFSLGALSACNDSTPPPFDPGPSFNSNSNWLLACEADADCDGELMCLCGVCSLACTDDTACTGEGLTCASDSGEALATQCNGAEGPPDSLCLEACASDEACASGRICVDGACADGERVDEREEGCESEGVTLPVGSTVCAPSPIGLPGLATCTAGGTFEETPCEAGCLDPGDGTPAFCADISCSEGDGLYCGDNRNGLPSGFLYTCSDGFWVEALPCARCVPSGSQSMCAQ